VSDGVNKHHTTASSTQHRSMRMSASPELLLAHLLSISTPEHQYVHLQRHGQPPIAIALPNSPTHAPERKNSVTKQGARCMDGATQKKSTPPLAQSSGGQHTHMRSQTTCPGMHGHLRARSTPVLAQRAGGDSSAALLAVDAADTLWKRRVAPRGRAPSTLGTRTRH
jgi:hypothetical protein